MQVFPDWPAQDYCMLRKYKKRQRGTVCIKKIIQKSSIFLTQGKIIWGPREEQDGYPSHGVPHPSGVVHRPSCRIYKISSGMMSFSSCRIAFRGYENGFHRRGIEHQFGVM
jgi:hypothetical protein